LYSVGRVRVFKLSFGVRTTGPQRIATLSAEKIQCPHRYCDDLEAWLDQAVFSQLQNAGIAVTPGAKALIAYVIQSQAQTTEGIPPAIGQLYGQFEDRITTGGSADQKFFQNALAVYRGLYPLPNAALNVNWAVRLLTQLYLTALGNFRVTPRAQREARAGKEGAPVRAVVKVAGREPPPQPANRDTSQLPTS
jgi:hypothetical protein